MSISIFGKLKAICPLFRSEGLILEQLDRFALSESGIRDRWNWFNCFQNNLCKYLQNEYPQSKIDWHSDIDDLMISTLIRENIKRTESEYISYRHCMAPLEQNLCNDSLVQLN